MARLRIVWLVASALTVLSSCTDDPEDNPQAESLAHDIEIRLVELNQGVAISIARDGDWIAPEDRAAPVVMGGRSRSACCSIAWTSTSRS